MTIEYDMISCWLSQNSEQNCCQEYEESISSDKNMKKFNLVAKIDDEYILKLIELWGNYPVPRIKEEFISFGRWKYEEIKNLFNPKVFFAKAALLQQ